MRSTCWAFIPHTRKSPRGDGPSQSPVRWPHSVRSGRRLPPASLLFRGAPLRTPSPSSRRHATATATAPPPAGRRKLQRVASLQPSHGWDHEGARSHRPGDVRPYFCFLVLMIVPGALFFSPCALTSDAIPVAQKARGQSQGAQGARDRAEGLIDRVSFACVIWT